MIGISSNQRHHPRMSLPEAITAVVLLVSAATVARGQTQRFCEGQLGQTDWACDSLAPVSPEVFEEFLPLPGVPDPANPAKYKQIAGEPAFDEGTGLRNDKSAVFALTDGIYFCMLAESNGEAVLFDAPEGIYTPPPPRKLRVDYTAATDSSILYQVSAVIGNLRPDYYYLL